MNKIVITGATSFLGRNLINTLLNKGYEVYAFVRNTSKNPLNIKNKKLKYIYGTLDEIELIYDYISQADTFIHFAWTGSGAIGRNTEDIQMSNINYSLRALEVAINLNCNKFIFSGSQAEYGKKNGLITETSKCNPISFYGKAKLSFSKKAHIRCESENIKFIHLRIFSVYGFGDREGTLVDSCIKAFNNGETIELGPCSQNWNYLFINDFVNIIIKMIEIDCISGIYNIASPETRILKDFVKIIYDLSNKTGKYEFKNIPANNPEQSPELNPSIEKIRKYIYNYKFLKFNDGIREITNKMRETNEIISIEK